MYRPLLMNKFQTYAGRKISHTVKLDKLLLFCSSMLNYIYSMKCVIFMVVITILLRIT